MLRFSKEYTGHLVRALDAAGIVQVVKSAFDQRVEVRDHTTIETLPADLVFAPAFVFGVGFEFVF